MTLASQSACKGSFAQSSMDMFTKPLSFQSKEYLLTSCASTCILLSMPYTLILFGSCSLREYGLRVLLPCSCDIVAVTHCGSDGLDSETIAKLVSIIALKQLSNKTLVTISSFNLQDIWTGKSDSFYTNIFFLLWLIK